MWLGFILITWHIQGRPSTTRPGPPMIKIIYRIITIAEPSHLKSCFPSIHIYYTHTLYRYIRLSKAGLAKFISVYYKRKRVNPPYSQKRDVQFWNQTLLKCAEIYINVFPFFPINSRGWFLNGTHLCIYVFTKFKLNKFCLHELRY